MVSGRTKRARRAIASIKWKKEHNKDNLRFLGRVVKTVKSLWKTGMATQGRINLVALNKIPTSKKNQTPKAIVAMCDLHGGFHSATYFAYFPGILESLIFAKGAKMTTEGGHNEIFPGSVGVFDVFIMRDSLTIREMQGSFIQGKPKELKRDIALLHANWREDILREVFRYAKKSGISKVNFYPTFSNHKDGYDLHNYKDDYGTKLSESKVFRKRLLNQLRAFTKVAKEQGLKAVKSESKFALTVVNQANTK